MLKKPPTAWPKGKNKKQKKQKSTKNKQEINDYAIPNQSESQMSVVPVPLGVNQSCCYGLYPLIK